VEGGEFTRSIVLFPILVLSSSVAERTAVAMRRKLRNKHSRRNIVNVAVEEQLQKDLLVVVWERHTWRA
jgi:diaminopimelate epimerase